MPSLRLKTRAQAPNTQLAGSPEDLEESASDTLPCESDSEAGQLFLDLIGESSNSFYDYTLPEYPKQLLESFFAGFCYDPAARRLKRISLHAFYIFFTKKAISRYRPALQQGHDPATPSQRYPCFLECLKTIQNKSLLNFTPYVILSGLTRTIKRCSIDQLHVVLTEQYGLSNLEIRQANGTIMKFSPAAVLIERQGLPLVRNTFTQIALYTILAHWDNFSPHAHLSHPVSVWMRQQALGASMLQDRALRRWQTLCTTGLKKPTTACERPQRYSPDIRRPKN
ncbi:DNA-directed RNA polymerase III subunit rpc1 [Sphaceloma murrayae]|uniref:DNA-directed RNA polymerase III subunit rpc1 n=1 Tax=Sphaceloma murrayae TaxID=2082308 RepID=A0A2K1QNT9_9PEZI|nr:DNA-directed RNA polymerase III subunit rpc1 [Sphaceloma murrayae]